MENSVIQRLWNYCNVLRDDGVSYGDYVEQLTYLIFLKMAHEQTVLNKNKNFIPEKYNWQTLVEKDNNELISHYNNVLKILTGQKGMLGIIFKNSRNKIQDFKKLKKLIELINQYTWSGSNIDLKGHIYEGLLQKNAEDVKSGAGQYFTQRPLVQAIVEVMRPKPMMTICDPACGTGGFILAAQEYILKNYRLSDKERLFLSDDTFKVWEIVEDTARLCAMNFYLHGIGAKKNPIVIEDALISRSKEKFDMILSNPPFGKKSSMIISNENGKGDDEDFVYKRDDFWITTSNKQLNFIQHIKSLMNDNGKAAVIVPDNVLFEGGAGEIIRKKLLEEYDFHTILRLPKGIFYANGVKANVIFFDKKASRDIYNAGKLWIYDLRTNQHFTLKTNKLRYEDLEDFIKCYNAEDRNLRVESNKFKAFKYEELMKREKTNLDIFWLEDNSRLDMKNIPSGEELIEDIISNLNDAIELFSDIEKLLPESSL